MLAHGVQTLRVLDDLRAVAGTGTTQEIRYRFASVLTNLPGAWTDSSLTRSSNSAGTREIDVSATTDQLWVQVDLAGLVTSGSGEGLSALQVFTEGCGRIIASQTVQWQKTLNSSEVAYIPIGDPVPAMDLSGLMFAIVVTGVAGTITFQPAWRTYSHLLHDPNAWQDLGSSNSDTGNDTYNSGNLSVSPGTTVSFAQPGLKITTAAMATLQVIVSAKY
jgi:hypothetical protein